MYFEIFSLLFEWIFNVALHYHHAILNCQKDKKLTCFRIDVLFLLLKYSKKNKKQKTSDFNVLFEF